MPSADSWRLLALGLAEPGRGIVEEAFEEVVEGVTAEGRARIGLRHGCFSGDVDDGGGDGAADVLERCGEALGVLQLLLDVLLRLGLGLLGEG